MALAPRQLASVIGIVAAFAVAAIVAVVFAMVLFKGQTDPVPSPEGLPVPPAPPSELVPPQASANASLDTETN